MITELNERDPSISVIHLCSAAEISRSWFYARRNSQAQDAEEILLRDAIELVILDWPGYGYRRVTHQLHRDGWCVNHKRFLHIMRAESLLCQLKKRFVPTTNSDHACPIYINRTKDLAVERLNQLWVADITYIRLPRNFCYLAAILDARSRRCIGWRLSRDIDTSLTLAALDMAIEKRKPPVGLIHHSDRGVQYASSGYVTRLSQIGALSSMSARGNPYDNAMAESFFKTLKREEVYINQYSTFEEAANRIGPFLEELYNTKRLHSSLNYMPPSEFETAEERKVAMLPTGT